MFEVLINGQWVEQTPITGDTVRQWFGSGDTRHYIQYVYIEITKEEQETEWRNKELKNTDWIVPVVDHPQHAEYLVYRQELRDWPDTPSFPDTRPVAP